MLGPGSSLQKENEHNNYWDGELWQKTRPELEIKSLAIFDPPQKQHPSANRQKTLHG